MKKPTFEPLGGRILVRREAAETRTPGGVYLPPTATSESLPKPQRGVVLAVSAEPCAHDSGRLVAGAGVPWETSGPVRVGDTVVFPAFAGTEIDGVGLVLMPVDILGRFRTETPKRKKK